MRFIEASLIMPLTMLVISALIALMMTYYSDLQTQIKKHEEERKEMDRTVKNMDFVELAASPEFQDCFVDGLCFP